MRMFSMLVIGLIGAGICWLAWAVFYRPTMYAVSMQDFQGYLGDPVHSGFGEVAIDPADVHILRIKRIDVPEVHAEGMAKSACKVEPSLVRVRIYAPDTSDWTATTAAAELDRACP